MPRKPREEEKDAVHHVFARGNRKELVFLDDADRRLYLHLLGRTVGRHRWRCLAFCLMDNHMHLLIETPEPNLGRGMQRLQGVYAQTFNERHGTVGHVFQGRYGARRVREESHLWQAAAYIACNPVEAGIAPAPDAWPWSSHAATAGTAPRPSWLDSSRLLELLSAFGGDSWRRYTDAVARRAATYRSAA